jgi:hypothetical protein
MKNNQDKYVFTHTKCKDVGHNRNLIEYLKNQDTPFNRILLDSLSILWMPYVLDSLQFPRKDIEKEIQISLEKLISHLNLMCLKLNYDFSNLNESRVSPISNHKSNLSSSSDNDIDDDIDDDIEEEENVGYLASMKNDMQF